MSDLRTPASKSSEPGDSGSQPLSYSSPFDYDPKTRVVFGRGAVGRVGELARELGARRVLVVTDKGLLEAGHEERAVAPLRAAGLEIAVFDDVTANPTTDDVDRALAVARELSADLLVGLGGGSSLDCAKGVNFLFSNGGRIEDYRGMGKAKKPFLPMIAIPTTAGTGSEAQSYALIADARTHMKMACGDKNAACRIALLDPELTVSMPPLVTAATGIDAISHALESYVTKPRNNISMLFSRRAWRLLSQGFPRVLNDPTDVDARSAMLLGSYLAGAAIENSMLGATHALANPLSAHFNLTHGIAIGIMLPHVLRYNMPSAQGLYADLAEDAGLRPAGNRRSAGASADGQAAGRLPEFIETLVARSGLPTRLGDDVDPSLVPVLAEEAAGQWTAKFNPRPIDRRGFEELYRCALQ